MSPAIRVIAVDGCTKTRGIKPNRIQRNFIAHVSLSRFQRMVPGRAFPCEHKAIQAAMPEMKAPRSRPLTTNCHSIFETVVEIFHDLILEGDHACLCLPPSCASVARFKRRDF